MNNVRYNAVRMFEHSFEDYVAARSLIFSTFVIQGFILMNQSIEKMIKAMIYLETNRPTTLKGIKRHNPLELKDELQKHTDYDLEQYSGLLERLFKLWLLRYHDNDSKPGMISSGELYEFDELWFVLFDKIPLTLKERYQSKFGRFMFEKGVIRGFPEFREFALANNTSFYKRITQLEFDYNSVREYKFPNE